MQTTASKMHSSWVGAGIAILLLVVVVVTSRTAGSPDMTLDLPPEPEPPCLLAITATSATAYQRPSHESEVFGTLTLHQVTLAAGLTESGWIGFDPGVAQAPNVGLLRLRWLPPETPISFSPGCPEGPATVPTLDAQACYVMSHAATAIYAAPRADAAVVGELHESYAIMQAREGDYLSVDSAAESGGSESVGWVQVSAVDLNGQCN
jgi:hypothetical protein